MDLLIVAREGAGAPPTAREVVDPAEARDLLAPLPHGTLLQQLLARLALGTLVLAQSLDRQAARAAIGVAMQRSRPRGVLLLGNELGRELLGEGLPLAGGIREMYSKPIAALGRAKQADIEKLLTDVCQRAGVPWSPPGVRAVAARTVVRAEEAEATAAKLIEQAQWQQALEVLRAAEPLAARGTNMLGRVLLQLGDRAGAKHAFERTLAADPLNAIAQRQISQLS